MQSEADETKSSEQEDRGDRYLCAKCYFKGPELLPKGYEDVKTVRELRARKKELGHWGREVHLTHPRGTESH